MPGSDHPLLFARLFFAILICFFLPLLDLPPLLKLRRFTSERLRLRVYRRILLILWFAAALAVSLCWPHNLLFAPKLTGHLAEALSGLGYAVALGFLLAALIPSLLCLRSPALRQKFAKAFASLTFLLPVSPRERRLWLGVSLTAGICEELLYRGYLLSFLMGNIDPHPHMPLWPALSVQAVFFGLAHVYQGWKGVLGSAVLGLLFGLIALGTGSLLLPIVLHALLDARILPMYRPTLDHPTRAEALKAGSRPVMN